MLRLILYCIVLHAAFGRKSWCNHRHHDYKNEHNKDRDFHSVSLEVVNLDRHIQRICDSGKNYTKEIYYVNSYKLSVNLPDFAEENISVKLRHRVLFIEAYKESDRKLFNEIKILPDFVNGKDAAWSFTDDVLDINIPYKYTIGQERVLTCDNKIDDSEVVIQKMDIDVRFGEDDASTPNPSNNVV